ncbi:MAG TPA: hypothetical protein VN646_16890 [Candidatus Acidoferrum sp.]|nr:hypothetical protein [Candidatus Acidoferrum sp.]
MFRNLAHRISHQLTGPQGDNPTWTAAAKVQFKLDDVPISSLPRTANKLAGIVVTYKGTFTQGITTTPVTRNADNLTMALVGQAELRNCFHGTPIVGTQIQGYTMPLMEYYLCGQRWFARRRRVFDNTSAAAQLFVHRVFFPLGLFSNDKAHQLAQLALLYKKGLFEITNAGAGVVHDANNSVTITACTMKASAVLLPLDVLEVSPGVEVQEYAQNANGTGATLSKIEISDLGNQTGFDGVEPGAAIAHLFALTDARFQAVNTAGADTDNIPVGSFTNDTLTQYSAPFLGQAQTEDLSPIMAMAEEEGHRTGDITVRVSAGTTRTYGQDYSTMPYTLQGGSIAGVGVQTLDGEGLFFPLVCSQPGFEITKLPVVEGTVRYNMNRTVIASRQDKTLAVQLKSWTGAKWAAFRDLIVESGLAKEVLGTTDVGWTYLAKEKNPVLPAKRRFLPQQLLPSSMLPKAA